MKGVYKQHAVYHKPKIATGIVIESESNLCEHSKWIARFPKEERIATSVGNTTDLFPEASYVNYFLTLGNYGLLVCHSWIFICWSTSHSDDNKKKTSYLNSIVHLASLLRSGLLSLKPGQLQFHLVFSRCDGDGTSHWHFRSRICFLYLHSSWKAHIDNEILTFDMCLLQTVNLLGEMLRTNSLQNSMHWPSETLPKFSDLWYYSSFQLCWKVVTRLALWKVISLHFKNPFPMSSMVAHWKTRKLLIPGYAFWWCSAVTINSLL